MPDQVVVSKVGGRSFGVRVVGIRQDTMCVKRWMTGIRTWYIQRNCSDYLDLRFWKVSLFLSCISSFE